MKPLQDSSCTPHSTPSWSKLNGRPTVAPKPNDTHGEGNAREDSPHLLESTLRVHLLLYTFTIDILLCLDHHDILFFLLLLDGQEAASGVLQNRLNPGHETILAVEQIVESIRANGGGDTHPDEIWVLALSRREAIREQETSVGNVGQSQTMLTAQPLDFIERPGGSAGSRKKTQGGDGDARSGV